MKQILVVLLVMVTSFQWVLGKQETKRLVCYYNIETLGNQESANAFEKHINKALPHCSHLVYSYAQIENFQIRNLSLPLKPSDLKKEFPKLKIFLSLGGDNLELTQNYLQFLEANVQKQNHFTQNAKTFLKLYEFDGLDLAFPFPHNKPRKLHQGFDRFVKNVKKIFTDNEIVDRKAIDHKLEYTKFVMLLKNALAKEKLQLSMTVLPNVNSTWYFDIFQIHKHFKFINLFAFDFLTPSRNPQEADYTAPLYHKDDSFRLPYYNIDFQVNYWLNNGCPANKLNLGIATYGKAWKMSLESGLSGRPVVEYTEGNADAGELTKKPGLLSMSEICKKLKNRSTLRKVFDKQQKYGNYAFNPADDKGKDGIWISFEDPEFAGIKAQYVKRMKLGGIALYDLANDDYLKYCPGPQFPLLTKITRVFALTD